MNAFPIPWGESLEAAQRIMFAQKGTKVYASGGGGRAFEEEKMTVGPFNNEAIWGPGASEYFVPGGWEGGPLLAAW